MPIRGRCKEFAEVAKVDTGEYRIVFLPLSSGHYVYEWSVAGDFFAEYPTSGIADGKLSVSVEMERAAKGLMLDFDIDGTVTVECDRCLGELEMAVEYEGRLTVRLSDSFGEEYDGETMYLPNGATEVDLKQYIYESILLSLPYRRVHEEGACNPEMIKRIASSEAL